MSNVIINMYKDDHDHLLFILESSSRTDRASFVMSTQL